MVSQLQILEVAREEMFRETLHDAPRRVAKAVRMLYRDCGVEMSYEHIPLIVRSLDELGYFELRYAVETLAEALGVTKQTIYTRRKV